MSNRNDKSEKSSFWSTLPGCLTGIAAILTALGGIVVALLTAGVMQSLLPGIFGTATPTIPLPVVQQTDAISTSTTELPTQTETILASSSETPTQPVPRSTSTPLPPFTLWLGDFSDAAGWNSDQSYWGTIQFPNVNGDGKADVCGRGIKGIYCSTSNGSAFLDTSLWLDNFSDAVGWKSDQSYWGTIQFPDVNGDGKADVCGRGSKGVYCGISTGLAFSTPNQ